jgi:hypothetical protein
VVLGRGAAGRGPDLLGGATATTGGRPHVRPVWGVWQDGAVWSSSGSRVATHLERDSPMDASEVDAIFALRPAVAFAWLVGGPGTAEGRASAFGHSATRLTFPD